MKPVVGDRLPPFEIPRVSTEAMKQWAVFLADPNRIHLDVEVVKAKGLGDRVINQGPINVAYMMNMLMLAFPGARIEWMETRFLDNVYGDEKAMATGTVTAIDGDEVSCEMALDIEGRGIVNSGRARLRLQS